MGWARAAGFTLAAHLPQNSFALVANSHATLQQTALPGYDPEKRVESFSYKYHGADWAGRGCVGERQSPIDFAASANFAAWTHPDAKRSQLPDEKFVFCEYEASASGENVGLQNNGHSLSLDFAGKGLGGATFNQNWLEEFSSCFM